MAREKTASQQTSEDVDPRLFVASIEKAMAVLELFESERQDLSLTEIMARAGIGRSAVQRFVYTLHRLGYLSRDPATKRFALGAKVLGLHRGYVGGRSALQRARHVLRELNATTGECVSWTELLETEIVVVENWPSAHVTAVILAPGMRFEAISASSGQVLLAHAPAEVVAHAFAAATPRARERLGARTLPEFGAILDRVRSQGYALTTKAFDQDSISLSAPVLDPGGRAVGAVNLSVLTNRFDRRQAEDALVPALIKAARASR
ncbi:helix-turn-helix domain-containing protein [Roseomonas hellenica]|uniref:Helix-turn-helix domain-containing protein n=1 Tax=Plastoroseomonas hellenica TaxID=2687306 RepID=A0ABS5EYU7_9PROT|nr:helix-turn-helix domain-containing protein [Plastoroseomonas hellenica]MBR0665470.1 helix-turn-helix domain-containing protein [Plastoroseomonas hellenica]